MVDRKLEPLVKRLMFKYLGEMEEEDLIMFVLEHLKARKRLWKGWSRYVAYYSMLSGY